MKSSPSTLPFLLSAISTRPLTTEEIRTVATDLLDESVASEVKAEFLTRWAERGETAAELAACAEAFLPQAVDPGVEGTWNGRPLLDCCGTGGGGLNILNISTGMMFVLAALGIPVVKHGNRGITKKSGSADVLEALGIRIDLPPETIVPCLEEVGSAFLFAPYYHPSFATIAPVRHSLAARGQRSIFNLLGPLLNPARPAARLVGVFKPEHVGLYAEALHQLGSVHFVVACGYDFAQNQPIGEVSAQGLTLLQGTLHDAAGNRVERLERTNAFGQGLESLSVGDAAASARHLLAILSGEEKGLGRETILLNAAVAAWTVGNVGSLEEGLATGTEALDGGKALARLQAWQKFSHRL